jgi:hypothetical protein
MPADDVEQEIYKVQIRGTRSLLMHSTSGMLRQKSTRVKSSEHDPEEEARDCLYLNEEKKICVPGFAILSCMRKAAVDSKKGGAGKKTLKDYVFSGLQITPDMIELPDQSYSIDLRPVVVMRSRIMRARPLFKHWELTFEITNIDPVTWDGGTVRTVLESGGKYKGLLDFRPLFGTFEVVSMYLTSQIKSGKLIKTNVEVK